jgi:hypothetical protein
VRDEVHCRSTRISGCVCRALVRLRQPDHLPSPSDHRPAVLRRADFVGVWSAPASGRTIAIRATATDLIIEPPTLPSEVYRLDGSDDISVRDVGNWWIKNRSRLQWIDDRTLTLTTTSFTGWWQVQRPSAVTRKLSQLETTRTLTLGTDGVLTMKTVAADAKPWLVQHVDVLVRAGTLR